MKIFKKILLAFTVSTILLMTACAEGANSDTTTTTTLDNDTDAPVIVTEAPKEDEKELNTEIIYGNILAAYDDLYTDRIMLSPLTQNELDIYFDLPTDLLDEYTGGMPAITINVDKIAVMKPKEGKMDEVEEKLNAAKEKFISDELQYPMNIAKVKATEVVKNGEYIALILAGPADERADVSDSDKLEDAKKETAKGVKAFNDSFN